MSRLDSSELLVERQTSIHEVVGSSPTRRLKFSNVNRYNFPCARVYGVSPLPSPKKNHTACANVEVIKFEIVPPVCY